MFRGGYSKYLRKRGAPPDKENPPGLPYAGGPPDKEGPPGLPCAGGPPDKEGPPGPSFSSIFFVARVVEKSTLLGIQSVVSLTPWRFWAEALFNKDCPQSFPGPLGRPGLPKILENLPGPRGTP